MHSVIYVSEQMYKYPQDFLLHVSDWMQIFISAPSEIVLRWEEKKEKIQINKKKENKKEDLTK